MAPCFLALASGIINAMTINPISIAGVNSTFVAGLVATLSIVALLIFGIQEILRKSGPDRNPLALWVQNFKKAGKDYLYLTLHMLMAWPTGFFLFLAAGTVLGALLIIFAFVDSTFELGGLLIGFISIPLGAFIFSWFVRAARKYVAVYRALDRSLAKSDIPTPAPSEQTKHFHNSLAARLNGEADWREPVRGAWRSFVARMSDVTAWRSLLYMLVNVLLSAIGWFLSTLAFLLGLVALTYPLYWSFTGSSFPDIILPDGVVQWTRIPGAFNLGCTFIQQIGTDNWYPSCRYLPLNNPITIVLTSLAGLSLLAAWPYLVRAFANPLRKLGPVLLGPTKGSVVVQELREQRAATVADSDERLRQIERDLHDGTQAQLTTIAMQIGEVREMLESGADTATAASILATAHQSTKDAMSHLREIASGVRPASLDSGLVVALQTLCARSTIPVELETRGDIDTVDPRVTNWVPVDPAIRSIAYYTVNELLANAAKHSQASQIWLRVTRPQTLSPSDELIIQYIDNGDGGARIIPQSERTSGHGTGLAGLADRLATVDGTMSISSPLGGQTIVLVTLPATLAVKWSNEANAYV